MQVLVTKRWLFHYIHPIVSIVSGDINIIAPMISGLGHFLSFLGSTALDCAAPDLGAVTFAFPALR